MFASHLSRSLVSAGRPRLASSSRGVGALCANANRRARHASAAVSTSALADARERQAPRGWSAASPAREARARARLGVGLVPRVSAPARPWRDVTTHAKKKSDAGAPADVDAGDDGFDEDFDAFADDELMQTNEDGEALAEGDADIAADETIFTAGTDWGEMALASMTRVLRDDEFDGALAIFSFKVSAERRRVYVSVDALRDKFGSPTLDQLSAVSRKFNADLEENGFPTDVALEVASPGAERRLRLPDDLARFAELPMRVTYADGRDENDGAKTATRVMLIEDIDVEEGVATWKLADVEENRPQAKKGQGMNKKQREWRLIAPFDDVVAANLFVGF